MQNKNIQPLVSIITVVYNGEKYLEQTINSVINQSYKNIEYIIIDGGSSDRTLEIIKEYEKYIAYFVSEPDEGLYDAMNKGIGISNGELIGMINSDDWYELNAVELMVCAFVKNPKKTIFHADRFDVDERTNKKLRKFNPSEFKFKYYRMTYSHPSMFIVIDEYKKHTYSTKLQALSDYQFVLEAFLNNDELFYYIDKPIVNYRMDGISTQMSLIKLLKEGFLARKNAGMSLLENIFSVIIRLSISLFYKLNRKL